MCAQPVIGRSIRNFNIPLGNSPRAFKILKISSFKFPSPTPGKNLCSNTPLVYKSLLNDSFCWTIFFFSRIGLYLKLIVYSLGSAFLPHWDEVQIPQPRGTHDSQIIILLRKKISFTLKRSVRLEKRHPPEFDSRQSKRNKPLPTPPEIPSRQCLALYPSMKTWNSESSQSCSPSNSLVLLGIQQNQCKKLIFLFRAQCFYSERRALSIQKIFKNGFHTKN